MKAHGRRREARHYAMRESATADLFSSAAQSADDRAPDTEAASTRRVGRAPAPLPTPVSADVPAPPVAPLSAPARAAPPRAHPLWYAVVFPDLKDPRAAAMLQRLGRAAQRFTSLVSIEMPNALLLEIKGSAKLFGSLQTLRTDIDAAWSGLAWCAQSATAPTPVAALWLARAGKRVCIEDPGSLAGALAELPIACTCWDAERLATLRAMGVTRVGELLRLPRAGLARRLGPAALLDLDIALAKQAAPRRAFVPRERFRMRCDFETEIDSVAYLQKALEPLVGRCAQFLRERQAGVQAMELELRHRQLPPTRVPIGLASITSDRRRLMDVLEGKLQRLALAAPVRGMELSSGALRPLSAVSLDAFAGHRGSGGDTAPQLVERLRARLGEKAVYGISPVAEHRPEAAWERVHELPLTAGGRAGTPAAGTHAAGMRAAGMRHAAQVPAAEVVRGHDMPRPLWLLADPVPLSAAELRQLHQGDLALEEGPERIESGWWDGKGIARDYYVARRTRGACWWIFQERHGQRWYLHGVFA